MKALYLTFVLLIVSTFRLAAQSCPSLTQSPASGDICSAPSNQNYWYYFLGDETDTYVWSVTGGTIVYGGGTHDWSLNVVWNPGAPFKQIAVEKWTTWGAYCSGVLSATCTQSEALSFNGSNSRVNVSDANGSLNLGTGPFTIEAYVKLTATPERSIILSKRTFVGGTPQADGFIFGFLGGNPFVQLQGTPNIQPTTTVNLADGNCHHVAVRRSGSTISFFIDGVFFRNGTFTSSRNISSSGDLRIGADEPTIWTFPGWMGEIRIWNYARTDAQIQSNLGLNLSPQAGLLAYYDMKNPPSSQTLSDLSGNGKHGTLGSSSSVDSFDPTWLSPTQASCRVSGNFRQAALQIGKPIEVDSTKDISIDVDTKVFPNPVQNFVTVELEVAPESPIPIVIYDLMGTETMKVSLEAGEKRKVISLQSLTNGIYILRIAGSQSLLEKKIIVLKE